MLKLDVCTRRMRSKHIAVMRLPVFICAVILDVQRYSFRRNCIYTHIPHQNPLAASLALSHLSRLSRFLSYRLPEPLCGATYGRLVDDEMSQSARSMLQSRAFGSSSSSDDERDYSDQQQTEADSLINNETMGEPSYVSGYNDAGAAASGLQNSTSNNLASFEESFVPTEPPPAPLGNKPRPKTPAHKPRTASQATVRDAAGFVKQGAVGNRGPFGREDALVDMSRVTTAADQTENRTVADMTGLSGQDGHEEGDPSFERSESQSMHAQAPPLANVNTGRGKASGAGKSSASGSKQQLTLREQEKVRRRLCVIQKYRTDIDLNRP